MKREPSRCLPEKERPGGHDVASVVDALPDDEPSVLHGIGGVELILLHVPADQRADVCPQVIGDLIGASIRLRKQVQAPGALEQQVRPGITGVGRGSQAAHRPTQPAGLRVDEAGTHRVPEAIALAAGAIEAATHQVAEPPVELVDPSRDLPFARRDPFGARFGVDLGRPFCSGCGGGSSTGPAVQPGLCPVRRIGSRGATVRDQEQQAQRVFAGDLARRARAFVGRAGDVDGHLVRVGAAAFAEAPSSHIGSARRVPSTSIGERLAGARS